MKVAIIGPPQSGKSTLFSSVTGIAIDPYAARESRLSTVRVPDPRLLYLTELHHPQKVTEATIEFIDVPGCALDDPKGHDEWRRHLATVRQAELLVVVVRDFPNDAVPPYRKRIDARADFNAMWDELIFTDLESVTTRIEKLEKSMTKPTKTQETDKRELALLIRCRDALETNAPLSTVITTSEDQRHVASFAFLTQKPMVCVWNVGDDRAGKPEAIELPHVETTISLSASIESEIAQLEPQDRAGFLQDLGIEKPARDRLIQTCYGACGLISFLTMGPDEVRAWTIRKDSTAVEAAGKIHTDLAQNFIRAETVAYDDLLAHKDMKGARAAGKVRKEGKTYVVADGDILNILANA